MLVTVKLYSLKPIKSYQQRNWTILEKFRLKVFTIWERTKQNHEPAEKLVRNKFNFHPFYRLSFFPHFLFLYQFVFELRSVVKVPLIQPMNQG